jgi:tRNA-2-methylthio-N6-dimethylallyladenosine synthase
VVFGTHNLARAASLLERARVEGPVVEILEEHDAYPSALPARRTDSSPLGRHSAWVTIQVGCDNSCTFCIVPIVRGPEISRRMGDIVHEVEVLAADGVREITVLGQNVNSYGRDLGAGQYRPQFADLLRALDAVDGIDRIRFTSPHPKDLRPETIAAMAECASVCEHLHLPLQSGSDRTLARMHRGYTAERYLRRLADARAAIPDLAVTTDLIVGFPGETDDDFEQTLEVVDAAAYDAAYTFVFSPRPGTPAADMVDDFVAPEVAQVRMQRLTEVVERHALAKHQARVGRTESLLVEGRSKNDDSMWSGRTRQNKLVHFSPDGGAPERGPERGAAGGTDIAVGGTAEVVVTYAAPHWLRGDLVGVAPPLRPARIRIPVSAAPA